MNPGSPGSSWAESLIAKIKHADEALDVEGFLQLLDKDVIFRLGSQAPLSCKDAVRGAVSQLFAALSRLRHDVQWVLTDRRRIIFEAKVTYQLKSGRSLTLPYVDVLSVNDSELITDYRIYIDLAPMLNAVRGAN